MSRLRIFGKGNGNLQGAVQGFTVQRDAADTRRASLEWQPVEGATGYVVYFGTGKNMLYHSEMVYGKHSLDLSGLNRDTPYFFRIDAFNVNGITKGK